MLKTVKSMQELDFAKLADVYADQIKQPSEQEDFYLYLVDFFNDPNMVYHIWEDGGEYLCALRTEPYKDGLLVAGLHTKCRYRNKGYAKLLLSEVYEFYGVSMYSHVEKRNIPSVRAPLACGFEKILDHAVFIDGSVSWNSFTLFHK